MHVWMDGQMGGWMDGWVGGWVDGWMDSNSNVYAVYANFALAVR